MMGVFDMVKDTTKWFLLLFLIVLMNKGLIQLQL